jgi:prefoldin subunit 5
MPSIAELGIKVDSADAAQASSDLDKLTDSGKKSEEAAKKTGRAWEQALSGMAADTQQIVRELQALNAKQDATAQMMATVGRSISGASSAFTSAAASIDRYRSNSDELNAAQKKLARLTRRLQRWAVWTLWKKACRATAPRACWTPTVFEITKER